MTNAETGALVWRDLDGSYFIVPKETLEQGRVPAERTAELEQLIASESAQGGADGDDVQGHIVPLVVGGVALGFGFMTGFSFANAVMETRDATEARGGRGPNRGLEAFHRGIREGSGR